MYALTISRHEHYMLPALPGVILMVAVVFNAPFAWRRYPAALKRPRRIDEHAVKWLISHENLVYALSEVDSFIDVSEQDLLVIYDLATQRSLEAHIAPEAIELGHCYSNGKYGNEWSVRQVIDASAGRDGAGRLSCPGAHIVHFKTFPGTEEPPAMSGC